MTFARFLPLILALAACADSPTDAPTSKNHESQDCVSDQPFPADRLSTAVTDSAPTGAGTPKIVSWDGSWLAVWGTDEGLHIATLDAEGTPHDEVLVPGVGASVVEWTGDHFATVGTEDQALVFTSIDPSGNVIDGPTEIPQTADVYVQTLVWADGFYGLVYQADPDGQYHSWFTTLDTDGNQLSEPVQLGAGSSEHVGLAWTGTVWGVAQLVDEGDRRDVVFGRMSGNGSAWLSDPSILTENGAYTDTRVMWTGTEYLVVYGTQDNFGFGAGLAKLSSIGVLEDNQILSEDGTAVFPDAVWTGSELGVVWQHRDDGASSFSRWTGDGARLLEPALIGFETESHAMLPDVAWLGDRYGVSSLGWGAEIGYRSLVLLGDALCAN